MKKKGFVQVYTGNGKGKTTASLGLSLRASGRGKKVAILQFMKGQEYGEHKALKKNEHITIDFFGLPNCIRKEDVDQKHIDEANKGIVMAEKLFKENSKDIIVLDEILVSVWFGIIKEETVLNLIDIKPERLELILTGRYATEKIVEKADLVTEMKEIKHYYVQNVPARIGIEF